MDPLDRWRLLDELTLVEAAHLIAGRAPSSTQQANDAHSPDSPRDCEPELQALQRAYRKGELAPTNIIYSDQGEIRPDWDKARISTEQVRTWLTSRGVTTGFFFPEPPIAQLQAGQPQAVPDYLSDGPFFSPKLAAAIAAWKAVSSDVKLARSKSVKQAIREWLDKNYVDLGLIKKDGKQNKEAIEEIAKVANWDTKGGAPKTAGNG
jgi:hypothetical protein